MEKKIFVKYHLGLGDCIVHNGMIRKIYQENPHSLIFVPSKPNNLENVLFMYRDIKNINVISVNNDYEMNKHINSSEYDEVISSSLLNQKKFDYGLDFDDAFYLKVNMDPSIKKTHFYIKRDVKEEEKVYNELVVNRGLTDYVFLHEKQNEGIVIDRNKITNSYPIVSADIKYKTFSLLKVIENAKECHLVSSSFLSLLMCYELNKNVFAHMYTDRIEIAEYIRKNGIKTIT
jgi:hypothetical protein